MTKKKSRLIALVMLIAAAAFFIYALQPSRRRFPLEQRRCLLRTACAWA